MPDPNQPTILVTGSSGLIGTAVCNQFDGRFNVVGFDRAMADLEVNVHAIQGAANGFQHFRIVTEKESLEGHKRSVRVTEMTRTLPHDERNERMK